MGDRTVVFDTFLSPDAAQELRKFAEEAAGRKVSYVVNSHSHFDHVLGNCAFDEDTEFIAAKKMHHELKSHENEIAEMKKDAQHIISSLKRKLEDETDEAVRKMLEKDIRQFEVMGGENFVLRLPDTVFEGSLELTGSSRTDILIPSQREILL